MKVSLQQYQRILLNGHCLLVMSVLSTFLSHVMYNPCSFLLHVMSIPCSFLSLEVYVHITLLSLVMSVPFLLHVMSVPHTFLLPVCSMFPLHSYSQVEFQLGDTHTHTDIWTSGVASSQLKSAMVNWHIKVGGGCAKLPLLFSGFGIFLGF